MVRTWRYQTSVVIVRAALRTYGSFSAMQAMHMEAYSAMVTSIFSVCIDFRRFGSVGKVNVHLAKMVACTDVYAVPLWGSMGTWNVLCWVSWYILRCVCKCLQFSIFILTIVFWFCEFQALWFVFVLDQNKLSNLLKNKRMKSLSLRFCMFLNSEVFGINVFFAKPGKADSC